MTEGYQSILKNDVWDVVPRPKGKFVVTFKWIYKIKHAADGSIEKYKTRFVARGFSQVEGVDYDETFSLVSRYTSIHSIIAPATSMGWKLHQMVKLRKKFILISQKDLLYTMKNIMYEGLRNPYMV